MNGVRHEKYTSLINGLPFSLNTGIIRSKYSLSKEQNWHENIEIQLFTEGEGTVLLNGQKYNIRKDDIIVVNSNVLHHTLTDTRLVYTCIIVSNEWCKIMNIDYGVWQFHPLIKSNKLIKFISELTSLSSNSEDVLKIAKSNEILLRIMIELAQNHCEINTTSQSQSRSIVVVTMAIDYIYKNYNQKITLTELSGVVLYDKYALCREFKKYTGQTIFEFINHFRIVKAADLLIKESSVSKTAELCGFENNSFFTKTFKKYMGTTPSEYIKNAHL